MVEAKNILDSWFDVNDSLQSTFHCKIEHKHEDFNVLKLTNGHSGDAHSWSGNSFGAVVLAPKVERTRSCTLLVRVTQTFHLLQQQQSPIFFFLHAEVLVSQLICKSMMLVTCAGKNVAWKGQFPCIAILLHELTLALNFCHSFLVSNKCHADCDLHVNRFANHFANHVTNH